MMQELNFLALGQGVLKPHVAERLEKRKGQRVFGKCRHVGSCRFSMNGVGTSKIEWHTADTARSRVVHARPHLTALSPRVIHALPTKEDDMVDSQDVMKALDALEWAAKTDHTRVSAGYGILVTFTPKGRITYRSTKHGKRVAWSDAFRIVADSLGYKVVVN